MWVATLHTDSRKTCFITIPQKWGVNLSNIITIKIQQSNISAPPVYATCVGENGLAENEDVVIGAQFARLNGLVPDLETAFEIFSKNVPIASSVLAEPCVEEDWELLELNVDQIQSELLNKVRVVWSGAKIPIWLSDFVSLSVKIIELEPKEPVALLAADTEVHVCPPKAQPHIGPVVDHQLSSLKSVLLNLLNQRFPKTPEKLTSTALELRVLPVEEKDTFLKLALAENPDIVMQPYQAFLSNVHCCMFEKNQNYVGSIQNHERISYFTIHFVESSKNWPIYSNAIYLSEAVIRQLSLNVKQRTQVLVQLDDPPNRCEDVSFYTFVEDYDLKELEKDVKMWLQSVTKDKCNLLLNHGQHLDIPCLLKGKTNRIFIGIESKRPNSKFCRIDETSLTRILEKLKVKRIRLKNAPQFLQLPETDFHKPLKHAIQLGGVSGILEEAMNFLKTGLGLIDKSLCSSCTGCRHGNLLLTGPRGSGRTSIARTLCNQLESQPFYVHTVLIDCSSLKGKRAETLQRDWEIMFRQLLDREPSVVVLDDLDLLVSAPQNDQDDTLNGEAWYYRRLAALILELVKSAPLLNQVMVIATAINGKSLHPRLYNYESNHFFTCELSIPPLTKDMRLEMVRKMLETDGLKIEDDINLNTTVSRMDGYVAIDVRHLIDKAMHLAASEAGSVSEVLVKAKHLELALEDNVPIGLHGIDLKPSIDNRVAWSDVGGLTHAKKIIVETLKWPTQYPELFANCPIRLRSALLLYGAPGTGKTMLARAVATECEVNFISIKGPELLSKYIGASEESVRETFRRARSAKPCILFFDEFDSLAPRRGHDSTGVTDRVVNQLLTELDGVEGQEAGLWVLAATSRPDLIDPALLRPGRFDVSVRCPLPDKDERLDILKALSSKLHLPDDIRLDEIALETEHYSGADLQAVLYTAQLKAVHQLTQSDNNEPSPIRITHQLLMNALRETRPSVSASERQRYDRIYENFDAGHSGTTDEPGPARVTLA
ncbi:hypothetical protein OUZ56_007940 [Daphnia magna]|uniref:Peroxisomal ATPase PEX1 n=1 Tax=Daphnia magna TaxID=35525 RepID=A0ABR0ABN8_9CRUS|nr:hypothetical protein OUZ56_007940 [Daphnia magna]